MENELDGFVPYVKGVVGKPTSSEFYSRPGTYVLVHNETGKKYVGSTSNIGKRTVGNLSKLRNNTHGSVALQEAFNTDHSITVMIKPTETVEQAKQLEQEIVDKLLSSGKLTNIGVTDVARPALGLVISEETRQKISAAGRGKKRTEETCLRMSVSKLGLTHTEEAKLKMSASAKERLATEEGKANQARAIEKTKQPVICNGVTYPSVSEAARTLSVTRKTISRWCGDDNHSNCFKPPIDKT